MGSSGHKPIINRGRSVRVSQTIMLCVSLLFLCDMYEERAGEREAAGKSGNYNYWVVGPEQTVQKGGGRGHYKDLNKAHCRVRGKLLEAFYY